jgi:hypothetical protein
MVEKLRNLMWLAAATLLALAPLGAARADAVTYASGKRAFRVGILLVDSTTDGSNATTLAAGPENPDPYVFHIADQRKDVKPVGWEFINPLAPRVVTQDIIARWSARDPNNPYQIGTNVTKDMAAYWEVPLTRTSVSDLLQFDALLLTTHRLVRFTPSDREKLRKLVDAGGMLWLDDCGGMRMSASGPFFLEQLQFQGTAAPGGGGSTPLVFQPNHAILSTPYRLTLPQIALIGEYTDYRNRALAAIDPVTGMDVSAAPNPNILTNVVGNAGVGGLPYIAVANYGSGLVVTTAGDTGCAINDYVGGTTNQVGSGPNSGAYLRNGRLERAHDEDLLFLYNLVQLGASNNTYRRNSRRVGSSGENLRAPLTTAFDFTSPGAPADARVNSMSAPLVVRDKVYVSGVDNTGALTVRCYNAKPSFNRGDQGVPDLAFGAPYDEVWRTTLPNPSGRQPSAPVLATVYNGANYRDFIFVNTGDGSLVKLDALPTDLAGNSLPINPLAGGNAVILKGTPATYDQCLINGVQGPAPAPVFFENRLYVAQPDGVIRCIDANGMGSLWTSIDQPVTAGQEITPTGSPTLGVIRQQETGQRDGNQPNVASRSNGNTSDVILYVPVAKADTNSGSGFVSKILPFWLGTRHEVIEAPNGTPGDYSTRVATDPRVWVANTVANPLVFFIRPRVRVFDNRANMEAGIANVGYPNSIVTDNGVVQVRDGANNPPPPGTPLVVSVDYDTLGVPVGPGPGVPPGLAASPGDDGARRAQGNDGALDLNEYRGGLETTALGPEDIQFFAGQVNSGPSGAPAGTKTVFLGVREQYGARNPSPGGSTKLRQAFTVLEEGGNVVFPMSVNVAGQTLQIAEQATFRNPFVFGPGLPGTGNGVLAPGLGTALAEVRPIGPPVISQDGGTVYQLMVSGNIAILAAFDADRDVTIRIKPFNPAANVIVQQANGLLHPDTTNPLGVVQAVLAGRAQNGGNNNSSNGVLDGDADAGRITVRNMATGGGRFSSSQSFIITYTPQGATQPVTEVVSPSARLQTANNATAENPTLPQDYNPLLWYYVLPTRPTGAATRVGELLYFPSREGIIAVDADPTQTDPDVRAGEPVRNVFDTINGNAVAINHVRWVQPLNNGAGTNAESVASVTAGPDIIVANTFNATVADNLGTFAFENSITLVADTNRIIEVGGDGTPLWAMDGTINSTIVGGQLPIFDPTNPALSNLPGRVVTERRGFSKPGVARRLSANDYLVADTGNNRVVRANRAATVGWELNRFNDPYGILDKSDPLTLSNPTDVQLYVQPTPLDPSNPLAGQFVGYEEHYLIADSGNNRVIEVVDYRDAQGLIRAPGEKVVVWTSRTLSKQGRKLSFKSAQRVYVNENGVFGVPQLIATVDNATAAGGGAASDFTGGSLVQLDYRPINTFFVLRNAANGNVLPAQPWPAAGTPTGSGYPWPTVPATPEPQTNGLIANVVDTFIFKAGTLGSNGAFPVDTKYRLTKPTFFQQLTLRGATSTDVRSIFLICDVNGAYQVESVAGELVVTWFLNKADYQRIAALRAGIAYVPGDPILPPFRPVSAQRLPNGHVLITNAASGPTGLFDGGQFRGETLEVTGDLRFNPPGFTGPLALPVFGNFAAPSWNIRRPGVGRVVIKQQMGASEGTQPLEQPLFADRL